MKPNFIYLNGNIVEYEKALVHIDDRGFLHGDGIYEVYVINSKGEAIDEDLHLERLERSLKYINVELPFKTEEISNIVKDLYKKNNFQSKQAQVFIEITRGNLGPRDKGTPFSKQPTISIVVRQIDLDEFKQEITLCSHADMRWQRRDIKTIQRLPNEMATQKARDLGYDDAVLIDNGIITESPASNLFLATQDDEIWTHPSTNKILSGITRRRAIEIAQKLGYKMIEKCFEYSDLASAKELFLSSSLTRIRSVIQFDDIKYTDHTISKVISKEYNRQF